MSATRKLKLPAINLDATRNIYELIEEVIPDSASWIDSPNGHFDARTPRQAIESGEEASVRNMVLAVKHGMFS